MSDQVTLQGSFSAHSAGGKISLLNEVSSFNGNGNAQPKKDRLEPPSLPTSANRSTSSSPSVDHSPYSNNPSGSGGESNGTSLTSLAPSGQSSRDDSADSSSGKKDTGRRGDAIEESQTRSNASSSSASLDDRDESADAELSKKRRRDSDSRADRTVKSRNRNQPLRNMLGSSRLATSPSPMRARTETEGVPMNMHDATTKHKQGRRSRESSSAAKSSDSGRKSGSAQSSNGGGKKRYPCSFPGCEKTFSTSGHAARHNRIHTGSKPYRCTFPGCNASFSRQDNSLQHYRTHVLHPKSRANGNASLEGEKTDAKAMDEELANLDPETVATVQMGRKALEDGTAIAVVQEFIDGNGRKAEAIQRMVGQPKSGRRSSNAIPMQMPPQSSKGEASKWNNEGTDHRRMSMDEAQHPQYMYPEHVARSNLHAAQSPPSHYPSYGHGEYVGYAQSQQPTATSMHHLPPPPPPPGGHYAMYYQQPYPYHGGMHSDTRDPYAMHAEYHQGSLPPAPPQPHYVDSAYRGSQEYGERARTASSEVSRVGAYHPMYNAPPPPPQYGYDGAYSDGYAHHRRSTSATYSNAYGMRSYDQLPSRYDHRNDANDAPSPQLSVRSFRSDGPREIGNRNGALSLLSNAAAPLPPARTKRGSIASSMEKSSSPLSGGMRSRTKTSDLHLSLPSLPAMSKLPYSSDRSTNGLTPGTTSPLSEKIKARHDKEMGIDVAPPSGLGREIPSLRGKASQ